MRCDEGVEFLSAHYLRVKKGLSWVVLLHVSFACPFFGPAVSNPAFFQVGSSPEPSRRIGSHCNSRVPRAGQALIEICPVCRPTF